MINITKYILCMGLFLFAVQAVTSYINGNFESEAIHFGPRPK